MDRRAYRLGGDVLFKVRRDKGPRGQALNSRLVFAVISSACWSACQYGYNIEVMNAPQDVMTRWLEMSALPRIETNSTIEPMDETTVLTVWSVIVSIYCVGGMMGGLFTGIVAERFGRKGGLLLSNAFAFVAAVLLGTAKKANSAALLIFGRLVIGVNNGLNAGLAPMYLVEISPASLRGPIGTVCQLVIAIMILLSQILGQRTILGNDEWWPLLLCIIGVPCVLQCVMLPFCPESPKYLLINKGKEVKAQKALVWLRDTDSVYSEMDDIKEEAMTNHIDERVTLNELVSHPEYRQPLIIAVIVMLAQQLSGIHSVMLYSTEIFQNAGLTNVAAQTATLGMGVMNVVMTLVSLFLIDTAKRKTWLLIGFFGMMLCNIALTVVMVKTDRHGVYQWLCVALVILFVVMFSLGPGSVPWLLVTELFNQSARPAATAVAVTVNWTAYFIVGLTFLPLAAVLDGYVFAIFAVLQLFFIIFIYFKVPETKDKTTEEISAMFKKGEVVDE